VSDLTGGQVVAGANPVSPRLSVRHCQSDTCQPDTGQRDIGVLQKQHIRYPPGVWMATRIATQLTDRVSRRGRRLRLASLETDTKFWDAPGRAAARPAVDRPEVVESRLGQSQLILKPGCVAPVRGILSGFGLAQYLADTTT
jgi:hypothetical protein